MKRGELWWADLGAYRQLEQTDEGPPQDSVALAFQLRAIPKSALRTRVRSLSAAELAELELAADEALGRVEQGGSSA